MFCRQCEQTKNGDGCVDIPVGICGKSHDLAGLQDLLIHMCQQLSAELQPLPKLTETHKAEIAFLYDALFATVTNVNFDPWRFEAFLEQAAGYLKDLGCVETVWHPDMDRLTAVSLGESRGPRRAFERHGEDVGGLQELLLFGLKGVAAYGHHARILGKADSRLDAFLVEALAALHGDLCDVNALIALNMRCGEATLWVLELLDGANTGAYGHPEPTKVLMGHKKGKAILVSGHDLKDLEALLQQTEGTGIGIYTHGEMLPAQAYPELKKYKHLVGHFGGAWMRQRKDFSHFPGAILMTTNCLMEPTVYYEERLFTCGEVGWPHIPHISERDFSPVIAAALAAEGFAEDSPEQYHMAGFGHKTVLSVADSVIAHIKNGTIKHFLLVGGCDGAAVGRNYFTEIAEKAPEDWMLLTLGCGKFRLTDGDFGTLAGLPRLLDMGQCNDSFSAIKVAQALAGAFECDVNALPLSLVLSWYEQKAVCVLLALLYLGVKNIRLGPTLPAFVSPQVVKVLSETFNLMGVGEAEKDLAAMVA